MAVVDKLRLNSIKLAGFKSFVDSTTVPFPSQLSAIVGPNGCGKSNIIDAVRWVMGESSAKYLRGENLTDVIFNGSSARKPVGQASVELIFDNPHGALGGEYAQFAQISIKRMVNREGQSHYYLNQVRCRRRDIVHVFLGTGLGPRSYAIIEQGMISRLIEAKPDELRNNLEEAAEISKYKERRRETENRIRHTRENLERLNDIREELGKQLARLQRQASAAERYKILKEEERELKATLTVFRWNQLNENIQQLDEKIRQLNVQLEQIHSEQTEAHKQIEITREAYEDALEFSQQQQALFYETGAEVARIEQSLQHQKERQHQYQSDIQEIILNLTQHEQDHSQGEDWLLQVDEQLSHLTPLLEDSEKKAKIAHEELALAETGMQEWQTQWDGFNQQSAAAQQGAQVQQTRIQHLEQTLKDTHHQLEKSSQEKNLLNPHSFEEGLTLDRSKYEDLEKEQKSAAHGLNELKTQITQYRLQIENQQKVLNETQTQLQQKEGRFASLEALQQAALGRNNKNLSQWLSQQGLNESPRLAEGVEAAPGWERALETVLGEHLQALCLKNVDPILGLLDSLDTPLTIFDISQSEQAASEFSSFSLPLLMEKVSSPWPVSHMLAGVYAAENLNEALQFRKALPLHGSIVTKEGLWLSSHWIRVFKVRDEKAGILEREQELKELKQALQEMRARLSSTQETLAKEKAHLLEAEQLLEKAQKRSNELSNECAQVLAQIKIKENKIETMRHRVQQLLQNETALQERNDVARKELMEARVLWEEAMTQLEACAQQREGYIKERELLQQRLQQAKQFSRDYQEEAHKVSLEFHKLITEKEGKKLHLTRLQQQMSQDKQRHESLTQSFTAALQPIEQFQKDLEKALHERGLAEENLSKARIKKSEVEHELNTLEEKKEATEKAAHGVRDQLQNYRMSWQEATVRKNTLEEQLVGENESLEARLQTLPEIVNEQALSEQLTQTTDKIQRLGAINLAAIDEYETEQTRKEYLDKQNDDLMEALETLENAIKKIDKETRQRFKETFDVVNEHFKMLFPKVFNGGSASLELTSDDLLEAGIVVNARPPGKRNSTIHLLSGGEKALTAIALVFSIFQLNPAPFCMLDEVDAPLDDANVLRYCHLVKEMSEHVQFIFISHNKLAIEMAHHLAGVTMKEPGVSRMVAVDIDEAMAMAES